MFNLGLQPFHKVTKLDVANFLVQSFIYRKVSSSNTSGLEAHAGVFRLLMKENFDPYLL